MAKENSEKRMISYGIDLNTIPIEEPECKAIIPIDEPIPLATIPPQPHCYERLIMLSHSHQASPLGRSSAEGARRCFTGRD